MNKLIACPLLAMLLPLAVHSQEPFSFLEQTHTLHKYCFIKNEIPANFNLNFKAYEMEISQNDKNDFTITKVNAVPLPFPKTLGPNQLPVAVFNNGKRYFLTASGFSENSTYTNPMAIGYAVSMSLFLGNDITLVETPEPISEEEIKTFLEFPLRYFLGDQLVDNKIKIFVKKKQALFVEGVELLKVESLKPLPHGMEIKIAGDFVAFNHKWSLLQKLDFQYKGKTPIVFVKDFQLPVADQKNVQTLNYPMIIAEHGKCSAIEFRNRVLIPRKGNEQRYSEYFDKSDSQLQEIIAQNKKLKLYLEQFKNLNIYEIYPLGKIFPGNGRVDRKCSLEFFELESLFTGPKAEAKKSPMDLLEIKEITVPQEQVATLELHTRGTKTTLRAIKKYFVNQEWKPFKEKMRIDTECGRWCPKIFFKPKIDYLKDIKINISPSAFKEEDLLCGMVGTNNHSFDSKADFDLLEDL